MRKRNTILALIAAGLLTVVALTPAFAVGLECSDYPNLDRCPIYGGYGNSRQPASYQVPSCTSGMPRLTRATIITTN